MDYYDARMSRYGFHWDMSRIAIDSLEIGDKVIVEGRIRRFRREETNIGSWETELELMGVALVDKPPTS